MNSFLIAIKSFFKIWKNPELASRLEEKKAEVKPMQQHYEHLKLLSMLQNNGRLIDFLKEDISNFSDADVGASVRKIHEDCAKLIEETVTIRPLIDQNEGEEIEISASYDPDKFKLVGRVIEPPFKGIIVHRGWKAHKLSLPKSMESRSEVLCPAEIEIK
ncbi:Uncharacterized protein PHSC3_001699 [Chlamydiales bacterium STE3]|nr:Uncharacterized protein PHSC3_001699 [Chlamydiales bacterium STE3]